MENNQQIARQRDRPRQRFASDDDESSSERAPRKPTAFDVPDLTNLIADFCDDDAISKLSRVF